VYQQKSKRGEARQMSIVKNRCESKKDIIETIHGMLSVDNTTKNNLKYWCNKHRTEIDCGDIIRGMASTLFTENKITEGDYFAILNFARKERVTLWKKIKNSLMNILK
jgi:hypothetical protein